MYAIESKKKKIRHTRIYNMMWTYLSTSPLTPTIPLLKDAIVYVCSFYRSCIRYVYDHYLDCGANRDWPNGELLKWRHSSWKCCKYSKILPVCRSKSFGASFGTCGSAWFLSVISRHRQIRDLYFTRRYNSNRIWIQFRWMFLWYY